MAINPEKVVVGGLAAGLVMNVIDFAIDGYLLADRMKGEMDKLNPALMQGMTSGTTTAGFVGINLLMGIVLVFVYAAIRPRFGAGVGTAVKAGLIMWVIGAGVWAYTSVMGLFSWGFYSIRRRLPAHQHAGQRLCRCPAVQRGVTVVA